MNSLVVVPNTELKAAYESYRSGSGITNEQLGLLLEAIVNALPFLALSPAFELVYREARMDQEALEGFRRARMSLPIPSSPIPRIL